MTTIVLITTDSQVFLAADHKESSDNVRRPDVSKIVKVDDWFVAGSGDVAFINILTSLLKHIEAKQFDKADFDMAVRNFLKSNEAFPLFAPETREASLFGVAVDESNTVLSLIELDIDKDGVHGNVLDIKNKTPINVYTIGSGGDIALGAFYGVLHNVKKNAKLSKEIEKVYNIVGELDLYTSASHDLVILNR